MATKVSKEVIGNYDDGREVFRYVLLSLERTK